MFVLEGSRQQGNEGTRVVNDKAVVRQKLEAEGWEGHNANMLSALDEGSEVLWRGVCALYEERKQRERDAEEGMKTNR